MKKLILLFFIGNMHFALLAQQGKNVDKEAVANEIDELSGLSEQIQQLDKDVHYNLYGYINARVVSEYDARLNSAVEILEKLDAIDKFFMHGADFYPNDKNYVLYGIITKLTSLSVSFNEDDYIGYLRLTKATAKRYEQLKEVWDKKNSDNTKATRAMIIKLKQLGKDDTYTQTLAAINMYYDNKKYKAYSELQSITKELRDKIENDKDATADNSLREKELSFALAWYGYLYYADKKNDSALFITRQIKDNINEPDNSSSFWGDQLNNHVTHAKSKCSDLKLCPVNVPENSSFYEIKTLKYQNAAASGFYPSTETHQIINNQGELLEQTKKCWEQLSAIENKPITLYIDRLKARDGKLKKADYSLIFKKITTKNKGGGKDNLDKYRVRFDEVYATLEQFRFLRQCWSNMIVSNPDVPFFKLSRIKVDLGIAYITQNSQSYLAFFDHYKIKKKRIGSSELNSIKEDFAINVRTEINEDLTFCLNAEPNNLAYKLTKLEALVLIGDAAVAQEYISALEKQVPANVTIDDVDPQSMLTVYRSYLALRTSDSRTLKQAIQPLYLYPNTTYWAGQTKEYEYYFEKTNQIKSNKNDNN